MIQLPTANAFYVKQPFPRLTQFRSNILFEEGSQRPFITQEMAAKLNYQPSNKEKFIGFLQVIFTCSQKPTHRYHTSAHNKQDTYLSPDCPKDHTTPTKSATHITSISTTLEWTPVRPPRSSERELQISALITVEYYLSFVHDHIIRGNGSTAVQYTYCPGHYPLVPMIQWVDYSKYLHYVVLQKCPILKSPGMWKQLE